MSVLARIGWKLRGAYETVRHQIWPDGHWEWAHEFKTCPTGDRHCPHYYWVRDKESAGGKGGGGRG
jgi:hypothetical protein